MNRYLRAIGNLMVGMIKVAVVKLFHLRGFKSSVLNFMSPSSELTIDYGGKLKLGKKFRAREGVKIRVRKKGICIIGNNTSINEGSIVVCHERILIGDNVQFAPNVLVYDHDHDFMADGGITAMKYKTAPVIIGDSCWIGANTVILRGTTLGKNCVVGAGSVLKGTYPDNSIIIQKRETNIKFYGEQNV